MKIRYKRMAAVVLLMLLATGVAVIMGGEESSGGNCALYYLRLPELSRGGGDAVAEEYCDLALPQDTEAAARLLLERYWAGPQQSDLKTPLPAGLQLQEVSFTGGRLKVDVSGVYRQLSGVELTLADSCLAMTLMQLDGVYSVAVTVNGQLLEYRGKQELRQRDMLLSSEEELVGTVEALLWFVDVATGTPGRELREIPVYEGQTRAESIADALLGGPESETLRSVLPEEYAFISLRVEEDVCYVNLPEDQLPLLAGEEGLMLETVAASLCSLEGVDAVRFLVEGETAQRYGAAVIENTYYPPEN